MHELSGLPEMQSVCQVEEELEGVCVHGDGLGVIERDSAEDLSLHTALRFTQHSMPNISFYATVVFLYSRHQIFQEGQS